MLSLLVAFSGFTLNVKDGGAVTLLESGKAMATIVSAFSEPGPSWRNFSAAACTCS